VGSEGGDEEMNENTRTNKNQEELQQEKGPAGKK
jgi:hypothetical protein